uniref:Putative secreted protein n=1 Tax=Anopheles darlingi TaxID=43151 RepID=A0A2M4DFJ8_ANODA
MMFRPPVGYVCMATATVAADADPDDQNKRKPTVKEEGNLEDEVEEEGRAVRFVLSRTRVVHQPPLPRHTNHVPRPITAHSLSLATGSLSLSVSAAHKNAA